MEERIFLVLEENQALDIFLSYAKDSFKEKFTENPIVQCAACKNIYKVEKNSSYFNKILAENVEYPPEVSFWECCQACRDDQASYYDVALLSDSMMEYVVSDKKWFFDELHIEKRWYMSRDEIKQKAIEMRKTLEHISKN